MIIIKSDPEVDLMRQAGRITAGARTVARQMVEPGVTTRQINREVHKFITKSGASPCFMTDGGFPTAACISVNDEIIHGIPGDRVLHEIGAHLYFDVPKHSEYVWDGVLIENHRTILNVRRNRTERELNAVLVRLLEKEGTHGLAPGIQAPRATFNAIFLIRHAAVHFQKEGIVLRHLCDWACFLTRHWDEIDHALFRTAMEDYRMDRFADLMTAAAVEYLGAEVPGPECEAGMLGRFMEEVLTLSPMPDKPLPRLLRKLSGPYRNRWRLREVLRTPVWRYYYDTVRGQWNEKFTVFR